MTLIEALAVARNIDAPQTARNLAMAKLRRCIGNHVARARQKQLAAGRIVDVDDIAQDASFKLLKCRPPRFLVDQNMTDDHREGACVQYIGVVVQHLMTDATSCLEKWGDDPNPPPTDTDRVVDPIENGDRDERDDLDEGNKGIQCLDRVAEHAAHSMSDEVRTAFLKSYDELKKLALKAVTINELIDCDRTREPEKWKKARNAMYKRHSLARKRLVSAAEGLARSGEMSPSKTHTIVRSCQVSRKQTSSKSGTTTED